MVKYIIQLEVNFEKPDADLDIATRQLISKTLSDIGEVIVVAPQVQEYYGELGDTCNCAEDDFYGGFDVYCNGCDGKGIVIYPNGEHPFKANTIFQIEED